MKLGKRDAEQLERSLEHMAERNKDIVTSLRNLAERIDESTLLLRKLLEILQKGK